MSMDLKNSYP